MVYQGSRLGLSPLCLRGDWPPSFTSAAGLEAKRGKGQLNWGWKTISVERHLFQFPCKYQSAQVWITVLELAYGSAGIRGPSMPL